MVLRYNAVTIRREIAEKKFWNKINIPSCKYDCWLWEGPTNSNGYGIFSLEGKLWMAHRLAVQWFKEELNDGLVVHHTCHIRLCVKPEHLEQITLRENSRRNRNG